MSEAPRDRPEAVGTDHPGQGAVGRVIGVGWVLRGVALCWGWQRTMVAAQRQGIGPTTWRG